MSGVVFGLFGYIALLDIGLLMVAKRKRWLFLSSWGAGGTVLWQLAWFVTFFEKHSYFDGNATLVPMGIVLFFIALLLGFARDSMPESCGHARAPGRPPPQEARSGLTTLTDP